ncbi:MAG: pseudouridine synthase [Zoogloeaceae bacterium]|jgi:16S rRNA pseudouridine516 synthase|nr:pseudouridine synthase [Zoogloeaceae bacterium]
MQIERLLQQQGFGTRKECRALARQGRFAVGGDILDDPFQDLAPEGLVFRVDDRDWPYFAKAVILLHKPAGFECSRKPRHHPGIHTLLPPQFLRRGLQSIGRLDEETTGLLLLTDDGALIHALSSPRRKVKKRYRVTVRHPLDDVQLAALSSGVLLNDDPVPTLPAEVEWRDAHTLLLTLTEGRYHQVRRMLGAVGNRVEALCRMAVGGLTLPADLPEGQWRWLTPADLEQLWEHPA